jgi:hypothetical protein
MTSEKSLSIKDLSSKMKIYEPTSSPLMEEDEGPAPRRVQD